MTEVQIANAQFVQVRVRNLLAVRVEVGVDVSFKDMFAASRAGQRGSM